MSILIRESVESKRYCDSFLARWVLPTPVGAKEHEHADRSVGILESDPVALDSLYHLGDCIVLTDYGALEGISHLQQAGSLGLGDALGWNAGHHRHYFSHLLLIHFLRIGVKVLSHSALAWSRASRVFTTLSRRAAAFS